MRRLCRLGLAFLLLGGGCATREARPLPAELLELQGAVEELPPRRAWLGLEVAPNESETLEDLEVLPGVRVQSVAPGSPAALAGLRAGDVLLAVDGVTVNDPGRLEAVLLGVTAPRDMVLRVQRGTRVFETNARVVLQEAGAGQRTLYHVERVKVRAAFQDGRGDEPWPVVVRLAADSPLRAAGVAEGDRVLAFRGQDPGSAAALVRWLALELSPGEEAELTVQTPGAPPRTVQFRAWEPERVLTGFRLWPLWTWSWDPAEDRESLVVGDLILLSLFRTDRQGQEKRWSVLSILSWETGEAVLGRLPSGGGPEGMR